ncbi:hypothetical protein DEO72_LG5g3283 [Vigna unguiculata]|uniref:Uncharacterized protein n=1 Tax=Vigna unguiculata TaxID=3917 RepID=A0A4D6M365_VIGUN|nr:hypothetical protein DEO72_LG5g3283 [Vigna unguiculata]
MLARPAAANAENHRVVFALHLLRSARCLYHYARACIRLDYTRRDNNHHLLRCLSLPPTLHQARAILLLKTQMLELPL